jgi:hypothetical protein
VRQLHGRHFDRDDHLRHRHDNAAQPDRAERLLGYGDSESVPASRRRRNGKSVGKL